MFRDNAKRRQPTPKMDPVAVAAIEEEISGEAYALAMADKVHDELAAAIDLTRDEAVGAIREPKPILDDTINALVIKREKLADGIVTLTALIDVLSEELRQTTAAEKALAQALADMRAAAKSDDPGEPNSVVNDSPKGSKVYRSTKEVEGD